jgi:cystathionine gamma-synthase
VEKVWYPKWENNDAYEALRRPRGGYGALLTFLPRNDAQAAPKIFDAMRVCKGPSFGTVFSLACPFALLAHYTELDWAESCGVPRNLIRLGVGLEEPNELWSRIESALQAGK